MGVPTTPGAADRMVHLYLVNQLSIYRVAELLGTSPPNVRNNLKRRGVKMRSKSDAAFIRTYF